MNPDLLKPKYAFALPPTHEVKVKNNGIILGTETTGNYMSGISGTANEITVVHI